MGACSFGYSAKGADSKIAKVFSELADSDRYEYGHDAYSGDIGQKSGYRVVQLPKGKRLAKAHELLSSWDDGSIEAFAAYMNLHITTAGDIVEMYNDKWSHTCICLRDSSHRMIFCGTAAC